MLQSEEWSPIPYCKGLVADGALVDPTGEIWSRVGRWHLFLQIGSARARTEETKGRRAIKGKKNELWIASCKRQKGGSGGAWPWCTQHPTEQTYWAEGKHSGHWWLETQRECSDEQNIAYDQAWIALCGRDAYLQSIA